MATGIAIIEALGWRTIGRAWRARLPEIAPTVQFFRLEDYSSWADRLHNRTGRFFWLKEAMRGRRLAQQALAQGCDSLILATIHNAPLLPKRKRMRYVVYSDCAPQQLGELGYGTGLLPYDWWLYRGLQLGPISYALTSKWAAQGMRRFGVLEENTSVIPYAVDIHYWSAACRPRTSVREVLFLGGDFERKGGQLVRRLASEHPSIRFTYVTGHSFAAEHNERVIGGTITGDPRLRELVREADLLVLPTLADCSSIAAIECASAGMPAISTTVGGVPEVVLEGITGRTVSPGSFDALKIAFEGYIASPGMLQEHGENARTNAIKYHNVDKQLEVFLSLASGYSIP